MNVHVSAFYHIVIFSIWIWYSVMEGRREAYYYYSAVKTGDSTRFNLHAIFHLQRALVLFVCIISCANVFISVAFAVAMISCFSYLHNGKYYATRNKLDNSIYPLKWKDDSSSSTAVFEIQYKERLFMFIIGLFIFLVTIIVGIISNTLTL